MTIRQAEYDMEVLDELPPRLAGEGRPFSPLEDQLQRIVSNPAHHFPKWVRVALYKNAVTASATKNTLSNRHGDIPEVEGWRFEVRRVHVAVTDSEAKDGDDGLRSAVFAQYDGEKIVPGRKEQYMAMREAKRERAAEAKKQKLEAEMTESTEQHTPAQPRETVGKARAK